MCDHNAMFEHANGSRPRIEHGYCVDDNARLLIVASRDGDNPTAQRLSRLALQFVLDSQTSDGRHRNRMNVDGVWTDRASTDDCWGRAIWGLGVAATQHQDENVRTAALRGFTVSVERRSTTRRSMAFAALGAADVLTTFPEHCGARKFLQDALIALGPLPAGSWRWPEARLTYANAALAEAVIAAGSALDQGVDRDRGLAMLAWLVNLETRRGHLSVTGTAGRSACQESPQFDQQPIEAAAMADACWRASAITGESAWVRGLQAAAAWFEGENDAGLVMHDPKTGGGYDGLLSNGVNLNQGAESTLAYLSTMQRVRSFAASR